MGSHSIKWAKLPLDVFNSKAFQSLGKPATTILLYSFMQLRWENTAKRSAKANWVCTNKHDLLLPYKTFASEPYCMDNKTITRAFDSLLACGFLFVKEQGGMCKNHFTKYELSEGWRKWKKGDEPISVRIPFIKRGWTDPDKKK